MNWSIVFVGSESFFEAGVWMFRCRMNAEQKRGTFYARQRQWETVLEATNKSLADGECYVYELCQNGKQALAGLRINIDYICTRDCNKPVLRTFESNEIRQLIIKGHTSDDIAELYGITTQMAESMIKYGRICR